MPRSTPVHEVMTTDVLAFSTDENISDATRRIVERGIDAGPVVDADGRVVGLLSSGDLIMQAAELHFPAMFTILGATIENWREKRKFDRDVNKALGATVGEVMNAEVITIGPDATIEEAATAMHDHDISRLPVVDGIGRLVGIISRYDVLTVMVRDDFAPPSPDADGDADDAVVATEG